jgi:hypothetical protein
MTPWPPSKKTGANAGGPSPFPMRTLWAAHIAQFFALGGITMHHPTRRLIGFCLVLVFLTCLDCALTLAGQPTEYWEGNHTKVIELHPLLHQLLAYHPLAFVAVKAVILLAFISLILLIPRNSAMILSLLLIFVGLSGPGTWLLDMPGHPGYRHGSGIFCGLVILTAVGMAVGIRWPIGIGLPFGLRYGMIAVLFVIWLTVDFQATRQLGGSGLVAISPLLLLIGYCSYELFREMSQQKREL